MTSISRFCVAGAAATVFAAAAAQADVLATVTYHNLNGNFTPTGANTGVFTASAVNEPVGTPGRLQSRMETSRLVPVAGNANFATGFFGSAGNGPANCSITIFTDTALLTGTGSFTVTDIDGDTITGGISGTWDVTSSPGFADFSGALSGVLFNGATFNSLTGSWGMLFPSPPPYDGAIVTLSSELAGSGFAGIVHSATGGNMQITPAPGTLALLGIAGLAARRRRSL